MALSGELGAGKTCFIRGLARGLGVTQGVSSPTFVIVNQYRGRMPVFHIDAYRTESLTELLDIGFDEYVSGDSVTVIEWSDKLEPLLPPGAIRVRVSGLGDEPRTIRIDASEPRLYRAIRSRASQSLVYPSWVTGKGDVDSRRDRAY